jgi:peptide methionine sulfoxide reductase msrA/msrB
MKLYSIIGSVLAVIVIGMFTGVLFKDKTQKPPIRVGETLIHSTSTTVQDASTTASGLKTAILAGGCFWCVESDLEKLHGVIDAVSGYTGGSGDNPTYGDYNARGFREVVRVTYDPSIVSYAQLVEFEIRYSDPTDPDGSFYDRGSAYAPAAYYTNTQEMNDAHAVIAAIDAKKIFDKPIAMQVLPIQTFWPAEEYHQKYSQKNHLKYSYYRNASGRDAFIAKYWGDNTAPFIYQPNSTTSMTHASTTHPWEHFIKPTEAELRNRLTPLQYTVTQEKVFMLILFPESHSIHHLINMILERDGRRLSSQLIQMR